MADDETPAKKFSKGKQKIEIKKVEKATNRHVTFSKRKAGLFKKAAELSTLTGAEIGVLVFSQLGKVYSYGNPSIDAVIDRHRQCSRSDGESSQSVNEDAPEENGGGEFWWERSPADMGMEELERFKRSMVELRKKVWERVEGIVERENRLCLEKMVSGDDDRRLMGTPVTTEEQWQSFFGGVSGQLINHGWSSPYDLQGPSGLESKFNDESRQRPTALNLEQ